MRIYHLFASKSSKNHRVLIHILGQLWIPPYPGCPTLCVPQTCVGHTFPNGRKGWVDCGLRPLRFAVVQGADALIGRHLPIFQSVSRVKLESNNLTPDFSMSLHCATAFGRKEIDFRSVFTARLRSARSLRLPRATAQEDHRARGAMRGKQSRRRNAVQSNRFYTFDYALLCPTAGWGRSLDLRQS